MATGLVGDVAHVGYHVANTGTTSDEQTVELIYDGTTVDSETVSLAAGASHRGVLTWTPSSGDEGTQTLTVSSTDTTATVDVEVVSDAPPDSGADNQWNFSAGSGTTVADSIGTEDATYTDLTWESTAGVGGFYGGHEGTFGGNLGSDSRFTWSHFVETLEGTIFAWCKPSTLPGFQMVASSRLTTTTPSVNFYCHDGNMRVAFGNGSGDYMTLLTASTSLVANEWQAVAWSGTGSTSTIYLAQPSTDYTVTEVASESVSGGVSSDLGEGVGLGYEQRNNQRYWSDGLDLMFKDSVGWTQSALQSFVDDSYLFYD